MRVREGLLIVAINAVFFFGCGRKYRDDLDYSYNVEQIITLDDVSFGEITQFETVPLDLDKTLSLRMAITEGNIAAGRDVLEIGTGTGLIAVLCGQSDAKSVVAIDSHPIAVANAEYNAAALAVDEDLKVRLLSRRATSPFGAVEADEQFDLIIVTSLADVAVSNDSAETSKTPPGDDIAALEALLDGLPKHLKSGGRCMVACSHSPTIRTVQDIVKRRGWEFKIEDERDLNTLDDDFLPGMLLEIRLPLGDATQEPKST